jgi:hypothetical protein
MLKHKKSNTSAYVFSNAHKNIKAMLTIQREDILLSRTASADLEPQQAQVDFVNQTIGFQLASRYSNIHWNTYKLHVDNGLSTLQKYSIAYDWDECE